ncbi:uncharacterized protein LOC132196148 [Neocloeon triangulifer]|uniref:uncharacterized protein LOC132196148 n=1 Tax=Neocloeon triangulifer TaxID=2078957 RepID=UPI00286F57C9|nr:uncharacterized protein LOC132196148 [Neocloeon triangulifer]
MATFKNHNLWCWWVVLVAIASSQLHRVASLPRPAAYKDNSVKGYLAERSCWGNEICKEEFQTQFRCRCPQWSFCRGPGRYYNAYCTMTGTGYIWMQTN